MTASPATGQALVSWTAPAQQRRQPDHRLHDHPVHRLAPRRPRPGQQRLRDHATVTGLTNGTATRSRSPPPTASARAPPSAASTAVTPQDTIFDFATPRRRLDSGDGSCGRARREVHGRHAAARSPASASTRPPRTPARTSAACGPRRARCSRRRPSPTRPPPGWQTVNFASPVTITAGTTYVASYYAPNGHYSVTAGGFSSARRQPAAARDRQRHQRQRRVRVRRDKHVPDQQLQREQLLGRRDVRCRRPPGPGHGRDRHGRQLERHGHVDGTGHRRRADPYTVTPYIGSTAQTADHRDRDPAGDEHDGLGADSPAPSTRSPCRPPTPTGSGPASAASNAVTPTGAAAPVGADRT